jgi:pyruvate/2-oxoglutarate dehydrogenase complex dihydrolipoamide dehydrogenase (E3) component
VADILTPDLCVIGAGSGGLAVAAAARDFGASVVIVEKGRLGGSALNTGAIPLKALVASSARAQAMRDAAPFGIAAEEPRINFRRVHAHVEQVIAAVSPLSSVPHLKAQGVEFVGGSARFLSRKAVHAGETEIRARRFVIATGARPTVPAIPGLDAVPFFTTETILDNTRKLTHLVIIGAGATALELAQAYCRLGTEVTVVENGLTLAAVDAELAAVAMRRLVEEGVRLMPNAAVTAIQARSMGIGVAVRSEETDVLLDASHILIATDRVPALDGLDLEAAGIRRLKHAPHQLQLSSSLRTTNTRVYAVGDVAGGQSVPSATHQARRVVRAALLGPMAGQSTDILPRLVATDPGIAEIGLNETEARRRYGVDFRVTRCAFADNDAARAGRTTLGLAKLLTHRSGRIIGAGVVGSDAAGLVSLFSLAMTAGIPAGRLAEFAVPYPSYAEIAVRLGQELQRGDLQRPLIQRLVALNRLLG